MPRNPWKEAMERARHFLRSQFASLPGRAVGREMWEQLEEVLVRSDVGVAVATELVERVRSEAMRRGARDLPQLLQLLREEVAACLGPAQQTLRLPRDELAVVMLVGVNGSGKTTTLAKLAHRLQKQGRRVLLAAADTFRAAAAEQLGVWARRLGTEMVTGMPGGDPAAVAFDAVAAARARGYHCVLVDTAGRLHTRHNLMEELRKIERVLGRAQAGCPQEVLLVIDATTGQNAVRQAVEFSRAVRVTGCCLAKMDGTAKGGVVLSVTRETGLPVKLVGIGQGLDDLIDFDARAFAEALIDTHQP